MNVTPIRVEIEDGIADELTGTVIGDVAPAAGLVYDDVFGSQLGVGGDDVRALAACFDAEGDDRRVLEEQERVVDAAGSTVLDERLLERQAGFVVDEAEPSDVDLGQTEPSSKSWSRSFSAWRNRPASAPSISRWS